MSTVVDNDKYIINGSTLSDIGDALRNTVGGKTLLETQYVYYIADGGYGSTKITFDDSYFGITGVQKIKIIPTAITGSNQNGGKLYSNGQSTHYFQNNNIDREYIFTLPAYWQGQTWSSYGSTKYAGCNFKVYPLDANENVLTPSQQIITSKNYQSDTVRTEKTFSSSENFLVSQISPLIETINQNNLKIGFAWPFSMYHYNNSSNANSYNMKDNFNIIDLKQIELLFLHGEGSRWLLLEPSNTITHEYPTGLSVSNYWSKGRPVTTYEGYLYSPDSTTNSGVSTWRTSLTKSTVEVFIDPVTGRILNKFMDFRAYQHPAIIVYK